MRFQLQRRAADLPLALDARGARVERAAGLLAALLRAGVLLRTEVVFAGWRLLLLGTVLPF
jgi:hypothetical protein